MGCFYNNFFIQLINKIFSLCLLFYCSLLMNKIMFQTEAELLDEASRLLNHSVSNSSTIHEVIKHIQEEPPTVFEGYEWNEYEQGLILGAFFWLHWTTQVPGGLLAAKYGTKVIFGMANFTAVLCCFVIPVASTLGWKCLIFIRCLQGILAVRFLYILIFS